MTETGRRDLELDFEKILRGIQEIYNITGTDWFDKH